MKKIMSIFAVSFLTLLAGCEPSEKVKTAEGKLVQQIEKSVEEVCYQGIVYVRFSAGNSTWGSVKMNKDSKTVQCETPKVVTPETK